MGAAEGEQSTPIKKEPEKTVQEPPTRDSHLRGNEEQSQREKKKEEKKKKKQTQNTDDEDELQKELEKKANDTNEDKPEQATKKKLKKTPIEKERDIESPPKDQIPAKEAKRKQIVSEPKVDQPGGGLKQKVPNKHSFVDETPDVVMSRMVEEPEQKVTVVENPYREEEEVKVSALMGKKEPKLIQPKIVFGGGPKKTLLQKPKLIPISSSNLDTNKPKEAVSRIDSSSEEDFELEGSQVKEIKKPVPVSRENPVPETKAIPNQLEKDFDEGDDWDVPADKSNNKKETKLKIGPVTKKPAKEHLSSDEDWD